MKEEIREWLYTQARCMLEASKPLTLSDTKELANYSNTNTYLNGVEYYGIHISGNLISDVAVAMETPVAVTEHDDEYDKLYFVFTYEGNEFAVFGLRDKEGKNEE